ncbi:hypothetical protein AAVH_06084 [Aphelenchoides avenae]|nr:hypothetical protein AAVH_06084 [Aphelenchus avenae]
MTSKRRASEAFDATAEHSRKRSRRDQIANLRVHLKPISLVSSAESDSRDKTYPDSNNEGEEAATQTASVPQVTHPRVRANEVPEVEPQEGPPRATIPKSNGSASQRHALTIQDNGHIVDVNGFEIEDADEQHQYPFLAVSMEAFVIVPDAPENASSAIKRKPKKGHKRNNRKALVFANLPGKMKPDQRKKPFKCNTCDARFTRNDHLKRHSMIHTGERPFKCTVCPAAFKESDTLKHHMKAHGQQYALYKCRFCANDFVSTETRERHEQKNHVGLV